jgi:hypothetical protein
MIVSRPERGSKKAESMILLVEAASASYLWAPATLFFVNLA